MASRRASEAGVIAPAATSVESISATGVQKGTIRVSRPAHLVNLVPYLLGFRPGDRDLVVIGTVPPRGSVKLTLRWDIDDPAIAVPHTTCAAAMLASQGCDRAAVVGFGPDRLVAPHVAAVRQAIQAAGLEPGELLRADAGRYWSYLCTDSACCPPEGVPYSPAGDPVAAAFEAAGARVLASRDMLAATIAPATGAEAASMLAAVVRAARRSARNSARKARRRTAGKGSRPHATAEYRARPAAGAMQSQEARA
jgi:hypothetical protein